MDEVGTLHRERVRLAARVVGPAAPRPQVRRVRVRRAPRAVPEQLEERGVRPRHQAPEVRDAVALKVRGLQAEHGVVAPAVVVHAPVQERVAVEVDAAHVQDGLEPRDVRQVREGLLRADAPPPAQDLGPGVPAAPGGGVRRVPHLLRAGRAEAPQRRAAGRRLGLRVRRGARREGAGVQVQGLGPLDDGRHRHAQRERPVRVAVAPGPVRDVRDARRRRRPHERVGRVRAAAPRHRQRRDARVVRARGLLQPLRLPALEPAAARRHELRRDRVDDAADLRVRHVRLLGGRREEGREPHRHPRPRHL